jgi:hypothetical protein
VSFNHGFALAFPPATAAYDRVTATSIMLLAVAGVVALAPQAARAQGPPVSADESLGNPAPEGRRIIDVSLAPFYSIPDAFALCLEAFPMRHGLAMEGCASFELTETAALSLSASYRLAIHRGSTLTLSVGPAVGSHAIYDGPRGPLIDVTVDPAASIEAVWWRERIGFQMQLGAGAMLVVWDRPEGISDRVIPMANLTLGLAFRTGSGSLGAGWSSGR